MNYSVMVWADDNNILADVQTALAQRVNMVGFRKWFVIINLKIHSANLAPVVVNRFQ
jgi:hypothetical protein